MTLHELRLKSVEVKVKVKVGDGASEVEVSIWTEWMSRLAATTGCKDVLLCCTL